MSVRAGRRYLLVASAALLVGLLWLAVALSSPDPWSTATSWSAALVLFAVVALAVGGLVLPRFVEAALEGEEVALRFVLGRDRAIPVREIDEVVIVQQLVLPTRTGPSSAARVILRGGEESLAAFTPRELGVVDSLGSLGCRVTLIREPLTPAQVRRRYRHGVSVGELITGAIPWFAIVVGLGVLVWALVATFTSA